jgi:rRNA-processing protein FCF1
MERSHLNAKLHLYRSSDGSVGQHIVIFDSNFLLLPSQHKLDIYTELERILPEPATIRIYSALFLELEKKIHNLSPTVKLAREYKLARQILEQHPHDLIELKPVEGIHVDDFLLNEAVGLKNKGNYVYLATNDAALRKKCNMHQISTIYARGLQKLEIG